MPFFLPIGSHLFTDEFCSCLPVINQPSKHRSTAVCSSCTCDQSWCLRSSCPSGPSNHRCCLHLPVGPFSYLTGFHRHVPPLPPVPLVLKAYYYSPHITLVAYRCETQCKGFAYQGKGRISSTYSKVLFLCFG